MNAHRYEQIRGLYQRVYGLDAAGRDAVLATACGSDPDLRREVESLLAHSQSRDEFLERPVIDTSLRFPESAPLPRLPLEFGNFRLLERIDEGSMGVVYRAAQLRPPRDVAVKLLKAGLHSRSAVDRFEREARLLARLSHPGICHIHEFGLAEIAGTRRPFLAMELVRGQPLIDYAHARSLPLRQRLLLIAQLADALHHAHQRGVIHRDLKPANVLVTHADESPQAAPRIKMLDFGVACLFESTAAADTRQTHAGQLVGTLAYMSPEQIAGDPRSLDTRTDVYSLGVVAYELLAGRLPYAIDHRSLPAIARTICEQPPEPLERRFPADVRAILGKALAKSPADRYGSAAQLADDIHRYLAHLPVSAHPPDTLYQLTRFARRHRAIVCGLAVALAGLLLGLGQAVSSAIQAAHDRDRALAAERLAGAAALNSETIASFLEEALTTPIGLEPGYAPVLESMLDAAAARIEPQAAAPAHVVARLRITLANAYMGIARYQKAESLLRTAHAQLLNRPQAPPEALEHVQCVLARTLGVQGHFEEAERLMNDNLERQRRRSAPPLEISATLGELAEILSERGDFAAAVESCAAALRLHESALGTDHPQSLQVRFQLAYLQSCAGRTDLSIDMLRDVLARQRAALGNEHRSVAWTLYCLGFDLRNTGDLAGAAAALSEARQIQTAIYGPRHVELAHTIAALGDIAEAEGRNQDAEALFLQSLRMRRELFGDRHQHVAVQLRNLGHFYLRHGRLEEARERLSESLTIERSLRSDDHPQTRYVQELLAQVDDALAAHPAPPRTPPGTRESDAP